jgi:hypothetical protein
MNDQHNSRLKRGRNRYGPYCTVLYSPPPCVVRPLDASELCKKEILPPSLALSIRGGSLLVSMRRANAAFSGTLRIQSMRCPAEDLMAAGLTSNP